MNRIVVGVDIAKRVYQLHWVEPETGEIVALKLRREKLVKRRPKNVAVVAMANKLARTIWALIAHERKYQFGYVNQPIAD
jgi:hypothetical protein